MKKAFMDPAKFMAKEPVISGGLCDIALATIESLGYFTGDIVYNTEE